MEIDIREIGIKSGKAARSLALLSASEKNHALETIALSILENSEKIKNENDKDLKFAESESLGSALIDRLKLDDKRIISMVDGVRQIISLPDPVGRVYDEKKRPSGIDVHRVRIPIGVIGIIYESRPNVTADASALCLKSGNAVILRGGKEAFHSNLVIVTTIRDALLKAGLPKDAVQFVETTDRRVVLEMLKMNDYMDVVIPRGGSGLIKFVSENSTVPVIKHDAGVCSVYIDEDAELKMAIDIAINSKVQRPGVCNAAETLLVHSSWIKNLPQLLNAFVENSVEIRGCERTVEAFSSSKEAVESDWYEEYGSLIISVKVVDSLEEAVDHIETYGSHHTDVIVTSSEASADLFVNAVDSSAVIVNASTRFNDGGEFGLGAEMGISTQKLHCRGPMGLEELTTYKFVAKGNGTIRR